MSAQFETQLIRLRQLKPAVLNLTNYVIMDFMANVLLALGAAPIMTESDDEIEELVKISSAININIGTLNGEFIQRCHKAVELAKKYSKPIVLDPVGSGASALRTNAARALLPHADIVKGNASEIISLLPANTAASSTRGVESVHSTNDAKELAKHLAAEHKLTVVISGPVDFITDSKRENNIGFGSPLMPLVTGMGCALAAVVAAFRAVFDDSFEAACFATTYFGLCGNIAGKSANHPGAFRTAFIDALHAANFEKFN